MLPELGLLVGAGHEAHAAVLHSGLGHRQPAGGGRGVGREGRPVRHVLVPAGSRQARRFKLQRPSCHD